MSELKSGDSQDFTIGDKTLTVEPVPYGNIKRIIRIAFSVSKDISGGELKVAMIPDMIDKNLCEILPLLFVKNRYPFLTPDWIEENMTVPRIRKIMETAIVVNGLQDFFGKAMGKVTGIGSETTPTTPQEKVGSTTSAASPTDGGPKT